MTAMAENNDMMSLVHEAIDDTQLITYNFVLNLLWKFPSQDVIDVLQGEIKKLEEKKQKK